MISLVWNSMMSWAGGWFFLMAAEIFTVGQRDFRLPGLGAYLHEAANQNDFQAIAWGIGALVALIVALDQFVWRPLLAWSDRFKVEMVESDQEPTSWFYDLLREAHFATWLQHRIWRPAVEKLDVWMLRRFSSNQDQDETRPSRSWPVLVIGVTLGAGLFYGIYRSSLMLLVVPANQWIEIGAGLAATLLRVAAALTIALAWIVPAGVAIGTNRRLATLLQPPSRGQVFYRGKPLRGVNPYATIVFQTFALFPWLSVLENVELALQVKDIPPTWNQARRR